MLYNDLLGGVKIPYVRIASVEHPASASLASPWPEISGRAGFATRASLELRHTTMPWSVSMCTVVTGRVETITHIGTSTLETPPPTTMMALDI